VKLIVRFILILLLSGGCSPWTPSPITDTQLSKLERVQAIKDWKCSEGRTDECSSPAPIHWLASTFLDKDWQDCCEQHDFDYNFGWKYGITKQQADYALWACVSDSGHPVVANLIYDAVHIFGWKFYQTGEENDSFKMHGM
jgi:hypothetical protein